MAIPTLDLLYAHGLLCEYAAGANSMTYKNAKRLCEVINSFQAELVNDLVPDAKPFVIVKNVTGYFYHVDPVGGW